MTRLLMPFICVAWAGFIAFAGPQQDALTRQPANDSDPKLTDELRGVEHELGEAILRKDVKALGNLVGHDFTLRESKVPQGSVSRAIWMDSTLAEPVPESFEQHDHAARQLGDDLAVVSLVQSYKGTPISDGTAREFYFVDFWKRRASNWQVIGRYSSALGMTPDRLPPRLPGPMDGDRQLTDLLRQLEEELSVVALHEFEDVRTMERLVAPEFTQRVADAPQRVLPRAAWGQRSGNYKIESLEAHHHAARKLSDDIAVVSLLLTQKASMAGRDRSGTFYVVDIWKKISDRWQLIARYSSPVGKKFDRSPLH